MENEKVNVGEELKKLEAHIGKVMAESAQDEIGETKREITKLSMQIEELLVHDAGFPPNIAATLVQNMQDRLTYDVGKNIASTRTNEYEETKYNVSTVEQDTPKGTVDKLVEFEQDGVVINNTKYGQNLEQICEEVFRECKMRLSRVNDRRVDEAIYDIRKMIDRTSYNLQDIHESFSKDIVRDVAKKVVDLGGRIDSDLLDKVEVEVDKATKDFNDFASKLQGQTRSGDEVARDDAEDLSENQKAFKDSPARDESARKDLEAMFK